MRQVRQWLLVLVASLLAVGCEDATLSSGKGDGDVSWGPRPNIPGQLGPDAGEESEDTGLDGPASCVLIPSVAGDVFAGVGSSIRLGVYQYSLESGSPMPDAVIDYEIIEGSVDGSLSTARVTADSTGLADVRLIAGATPGMITVRASSDCANPLDIEVEVVELPSGDLNIALNYPFRDIYDVAPIEIRVYPTDELGCREIERGAVPMGDIYQGTIPSVAGTTRFDSLPVDVPYTILATGIGAHGERAAHGCIDSVLVREGRQTDITVDLFLLPLDPVGTYEVISNWDFRDAVAESGEVGALIVEILDIFEDPGRGLLDFLLNLVEDYVGGIISGAINLFLDLTGLDDVIGDAINDLISSSPLLSSIVTIGRDIRAVIAELEVVSHVDIGKLGSDYEIFGVDNWIGLALYWRLGCGPTSPPDCGRIPIVMDPSLGALRGEWTGRVLGYNQMDIDRHPVDFEYGRLILYAIENLILPAIVGRPAPVTLENLMSAIVNCEGIGDFVAGGDGDCRCALGACICDTDVEGFCDGFISLTFGTFFRGFVDALSFDAVLDLRGSCDVSNTDDDLDIDELTNGTYNGNIDISGTPTPFTATFHGTRLER
jgi:hypothetical protein